MFNALNGKLVHKGPDYIHLDTGGVEWELATPARSVDAFGHTGQAIRVLVWLQVREDSLRMYGFSTEAERRLFLDLIAVDGIGPKQAMKILGGIGPQELERALDHEDLARLEAVPGLGKKTAQKLVFALKGRLPKAVEGSTEPGLPAEHQDIVRALADLGYDRRRCVAVVGQLAASPAIRETAAEDRERELFRQAIVALSAV